MITSIFKSLKSIIFKFLRFLLAPLRKIINLMISIQKMIFYTLILGFIQKLVEYKDYYFSAYFLSDSLNYISQNIRNFGSNLAYFSSNPGEVIDNWDTTLRGLISNLDKMTSLILYIPLKIMEQLNIRFIDLSSMPDTMRVVLKILSINTSCVDLGESISYGLSNVIELWRNFSCFVIDKELFVIEGIFSNINLIGSILMVLSYSIVNQMISFIYY